MTLGDLVHFGPSAPCRRQKAHVAAVGGRILATIPGALGTAVLAGRHGLVVCGCSLAPEIRETPEAAAVWTYDRLVRLSAERSGSLSVLGLTIRDRSGVLPLIALDPDAMSAIRAAMDRVQHLIDADHEARRFAETGWPPRFAVAGATR